jgi:hypothetical protein
MKLLKLFTETCVVLKNVQFEVLGGTKLSGRILQEESNLKLRSGSQKVRYASDQHVKSSVQKLVATLIKKL